MHRYLHTSISQLVIKKIGTSVCSINALNAYSKSIKQLVNISTGLLPRVFMEISTIS